MDADLAPRPAAGAGDTDPAGAAPADPTLPHRPVLRPGLCVTRRDDHHLQVGVDPPGRLLLPDRPEVRRLLDDLRQRRVPTIGGPAAATALGALARAGLLVDGDLLSRDLGRGADRGAVAAAYAQAGSEAADRLASRRALRVAVAGPSGPADEARRLLRASGCRSATGAEPGDVRLVLTDGPLVPQLADRLVRDSVPHLVVAARPAGGVEVGPFVVPGLTACLHCVDLHRAQRDPRRPVVLRQAAAERSALVPRDPAVQLAAVALAVRDLVAYADGDRPCTWSASLSLLPGAVPAHRGWARHPHCGCAWDELRTA